MADLPNAERPVVPHAPPNMPRVPSNPFVRWMGRSLLRLGGWRVVGELPDVAKLVVIVAPHSSNWDGLWGFAAKWALGLEVRVLGKAQLFWWPLGPLLKRMGAIPLDRSSPQGTVEQAAGLIKAADRMWYVLTPEGTRKRVEHWKGGFWKIAKAAGVPVLPIYFHYPDKRIGFAAPFSLTDSQAADIAALREWYRPWIGKNRGTT